MRTHKYLMILPASLLAMQAGAVTQAAAEKIAAGYVASLPQAEVSYEAVRTVVADLDSDGTPEILVQTALLGPTFWSYRLDVLADRGKGYRIAGSADLWGEVESMAADKGVVVVKSKMPAPGDPRCCPTLDKTYRYRWQNRKVSEVK
jgi:hypothetical protein